MKKIISALLFSTLLFNVSAQEKEQALLTIQGKDVSLSEFEAIYKKNNSKEKMTEESLQEYLELYIKFKLKVREAEELGLDTTAAFVKELAGYRKQLAQPYLTDKEVTESLIKEAYERMKTEIHAVHILIMVDAEASPKDTLAAYNKVMKAKRRISNGEEFEKVAKEMSGDPSVKQNGGDLGYFSALYMVYPFETAAYNTKVGELSKIVRTRYGYHLIKVLDKREARGTITTAHIMIKRDKTRKYEFKEKSPEYKKITEIYELLKGGETDFAGLAKQYSEDSGSSRKGGVLPAFSTGRMVAEYEEASYALKNDGDYSEPFETSFGWHIVKRINLSSLAPYDKLYEEIKTKIGRDSRANKSMEVLTTRIKKGNNFTEDIRERNDFYNIMGDEFFTGKWLAETAKKFNKVMFSFTATDGEKLEYTQTDFANYLEKNQFKSKKKEGKSNAVATINNIYKKVVQEQALKFKDMRLEKTHKEFNLLMQEYRDGILLFELTDEKVWSKAVKDTSGLEEFYETNKTNYMWDDRLKATIYTCDSEKTSNTIAKIITKRAKKGKGLTNEELLSTYNKESQLTLKIEEDSYSKGDNDFVDKVLWDAARISTVKLEEKEFAVVEVKEVLKPEPKKLKEVRGLVTSDYQNHLEQNWIKALKEKYTVKVNKEVLKLVK